MTLTRRKFLACENKFPFWLTIAEQQWESSCCPRKELKRTEKKMGNKVLSIDHVHCVAQLKKLVEATQNFVRCGGTRELRRMLWRLLFYVLAYAFNPKMGKLSKPQLSPMPLQNHLKRLQRKLPPKNLPRHATCFLSDKNYHPSIHPPTSLSTVTCSFL